MLMLHTNFRLDVDTCNPGCDAGDPKKSVRITRHVVSCALSQQFVHGVRQFENPSVFYNFEVTVITLPETSDCTSRMKASATSEVLKDVIFILNNQQNKAVSYNELHLKVYTQL